VFGVCWCVLVCVGVCWCDVLSRFVVVGKRVSVDTAFYGVFLFCDYCVIMCVICFIFYYQPYNKPRWREVAVPVI